MSLRRFSAPFALALVFVACASKPAKNAWDTDDRVPSNSAFAENKEGEKAKTTAAETAEEDEADEDDAKPAPAPASDDGDKDETPAPPTKDPAKSGGGKKASRKQCEEMIDKYVELLTAQMPQLQGVGKGIIDAAKAQARAKKGDPCEGDVTVAQHDCAMKAKSKSAWEACVR